ncbi:MAG: RHS repeat-associated core domain-containing protein, partial [Candidatus Nitrotoga sp.]
MGNTYLSNVNLATKSNCVKPDLICPARRITRNLDSVDTTAYGYDKAGRVTSVKFNNEAPVGYVWDAASRLTVKTLSNGVRMEYQYDAASRLLGITYRKPDNTVINSIAYTYDAKGQRTSKTTTLPSNDETPFTATYDTADRMLTFTLTGSGEIFNLAYDDNGNLVSKISQTTGQATTYTWNTRNWLTAIAGPGLTASFAYDALGRRIEKTVNGQSVGFLYDGNQVIAELAGNTVNVKLLSGIAIDEMLARFTAAGAQHYLTDALGSVVAMLKDDASVQNYYAYSPYGETTPSANDDGNSSEYTGRENDLTGVYYYRARYFDPVLKRFISADPIGLGGGVNFYGYVGGNPV